MKKYLVLLFICGALNAQAQKKYSITAYGASIALANNAVVIQKAIDAAHAAGGGMVVIPAGLFKTGPLILKSNVGLYLSKDALLMGTARRMDYSTGRMAILVADGQQNISVTGPGTIDGNAHELFYDLITLLREGKLKDDQFAVKRPREASRPNIIYFFNCRKVNVTGVTLKNACNWVQNYKECEDLTIDKIKVLSTSYWNNDGVDIVDCKNVRVTNSFFNASDDALCLKSENPAKICEQVYIENCTLRSSANGFKLGTGSLGGFRNITAKNLTVYDTYRSAVALETVDGGKLENIHVSHVRGVNTGNAIFIRLGHRNTDERYGSVDNVLIEDLKVQVPAGKPDIGYPIEGPAPKTGPSNLLPASVTGLSGHPVRGITLRDIEISYGGEASQQKAHVSLDSLGAITENAAGYPEFSMFGELPAWGLYVRHAEGITLENFRVNLDSNDFRAAMVFDDVSQLKLNEVALPADSPLPAIVYRNTRGITTYGLKLPEDKRAVIIKP